MCWVSAAGSSACSHDRRRYRPASHPPTGASEHIPRSPLPHHAGSSGSRVHVYTYDPPSTPDRFASVRLPEQKFKIDRGLSSYSDDPHNAGASLTPLLDFAKQQVQSYVSSFCPMKRLMAMYFPFTLEGTRESLAIDTGTLDGHSWTQGTGEEQVRGHLGQLSGCPVRFWVPFQT